MAVASSNDERIRHVVLLILENRSFDQMLGCFKA
jgi:phospholipase C